MRTLSRERNTQNYQRCDYFQSRLLSLKRRNGQARSQVLLQRKRERIKAKVERRVYRRRRGRREDGSVLRRLLLFETCTRGGKAELFDHIQREQRCYQEGNQHADDRP